MTALKADAPNPAPAEELGPPPGERAWPHPWQGPFLSSLSLIPDISSACRMARVSRNHAYRTRAKQPDFEAAWEEALELARDGVQRIAHNWITTGVPIRSVRTVTRTKTNEKGETLETVTETVESQGSERSATLMIFWLKAWYPERYRWQERSDAPPAGQPADADIDPEAADAAIDGLAAAVTRIADARRARESAPRSAAG